MNFAGFMARAKYYSVWCIACVQVLSRSSYCSLVLCFLLSESAFILSGIGYNPITTKYDASRNVRIRSIEFAPNFKVRLAWLAGELN